MDLDNQNSTAANTNTDSATPDFGAPVDADKPTLDMDAINEAVAAESANNPNLQTSFDVNDISLEDVPQSQDELDKRLKEDPNMSLAGSPDSTDSAPATAVDLTSNVSSEDPLAAGAEAKKEAGPAAAFVDGDIIDEEAAPSEPETKPASTFENTTDPLSNFETGAADSDVAKSLGDPAQPAEGAAAPASDAAPADAPAPAGEPAHIADTITMPGKKSKTPIIIGACVGVFLIVIVVLIILTASK